MLDKTQRTPAGVTPSGLPPLLNPVASPNRTRIAAGIIRAGVWTLIPRTADVVTNG